VLDTPDQTGMVTMDGCSPRVPGRRCEAPLPKNARIVQQFPKIDQCALVKK